MIAELKRQYDIVLIDTPAISNSTDAIRAASLADTTVLVVRRDTTKMEEVVAAVTKLRADGRKVSGIVLNSDHESRPIISSAVRSLSPLVSGRVVKEIADYTKSLSSTAKA